MVCKEKAALLAVALSLPFLALGCGGGDPAGPATKSSPPPELTFTLGCNDGLIEAALRNDGGAMSSPQAYEIVYADGERDTLLMQVGAADSMVCTLSNVRGDVSVFNDGVGQRVSPEACLEEGVGMLLDGMDLNSLVPRPLATAEGLTCTYDIYLNNLSYQGPEFRQLPAAAGLTLRYTFNDVRGALAVIASGRFCVSPDLTGTLSASSIVSETVILIDEGADPEITLGATTTSINGLALQVDGLPGFVSDLIFSTIQGVVKGILEDTVHDEIRNYLGSDLGAFFTLRAECG